MQGVGLVVGFVYFVSIDCRHQMSRLVTFDVPRVTGGERCYCSDHF